MSLSQPVLEEYIRSELEKEFDIKDSTTLNRYAKALSIAINKYLDVDVQVKPGQTVTGQDSLGGPIRGTTATPGDIL